MIEPRWLAVVHILAIHSDQIQAHGGSLGLRDRGLLESEWGVSEEGRRIKVYHITPKGLKTLEAERKSWRRFSVAVEAILITG